MSCFMIRLPIVLTGMPGSGKTTLGKKLANKVALPFLDSDQMIETRIGLPCREIFEREGEAFFRTLEYEEIVKALENKCVLSIGGGAFIEEKTRKLIQQNSFSIYLEAPVKLLQARLMDDTTRPLLEEDGALEALYQKRQHTYKLADATVKQFKSQSMRSLLEDCLEVIG